MGEFFTGWRRKAGLVTLAMAVVLSVGWTRSIKERDVKGFVLFGKWNVVESDDQTLSWGAEVSSTPHWKVWYVPYWLLVWPLTLLSAWLIVGKPRKAKGAP